MLVRALLPVVVLLVLVLLVLVLVPWLLLLLLVLMAFVVLLLMILLLMSLACVSPSSPSPSSTHLSGWGWQLWGWLELPHTLPSPLGGGRVWLIHQMHPSIKSINQSPFSPHLLSSLCHLISHAIPSSALPHTSSSHTPLNPPCTQHTSLLPTHLSTPHVQNTPLFFPHTSQPPCTKHTSLLHTHLSTPMYKTHLSSSHTPLHPHTTYTKIVFFFKGPVF